MTKEGIRNIMYIITGNYPQEAWRIEGRNGKAFAANMQRRLEKYNDIEVYDILDEVMDDSPNSIPSVSMILAALKRKKNQVPDYKALPPGNVNEKGVMRAKKMLAKFKYWYTIPDSPRPGQRQPCRWPPSTEDSPEFKEKICKFAQRLFPEMEAKRIIENFDQLVEQYCNHGMLDGHHTVLRIDKYSGEVDLWIQFYRSLIN